MYVNQAMFALLAVFVHRANICSVIKRSSRKSPVSHTFVRYGSVEEKTSSSPQREKKRFCN